MTATILALWTGLLGVVPGGAGAAGGAGPVTGVSIESIADRTEVVIAVDGAVTVRDFMLTEPHRLVIDLSGARHALPGDAYGPVERGGVLALRSSQFTPDVVRLVFELEQPVGYTLIQSEGEVRVSFLNPSGPFQSWSTAPSINSVAAAAPPAPLPAATAPVTSADPGSNPTTSARPPLMGSPRLTGLVRVQTPAQQQVPRITVSFVDTPILDVLTTFSEFAGRSIVPGSNVAGLVNAVIRDQAWDDALDVILQANGLSARELENGIIRVDNLQNLVALDSVAPVVTRTFRINYGTAAEVVTVVTPLLSSRGRVAPAPATNTVVVTDVDRVLEQIDALINQLDLRIPQVSISAKIIFVNRTQIEDFGVVYDLKDSQGNQLNQLTPGGRDTDGDGIIDEQVDAGTNVVSLGGSSIAALGNATARVSGATLSILSTLIVGRYSLLNFVDALQQLSLTDIQASPVLTTVDNREASVLVGERTPLRIIDPGAVAVGEAARAPIATVQLQQTGINLVVTPHITSGDNILLDIRAERSAVELAPGTDVGAIFRTQEATSRVLLRDGETAVIAGLTVTETTLVREGIPFLMDLPLFGRFFRLTREQEIQRDLMILVTPHIIRDVGN
ncbi:MAG: AMIN domain-containing protein [Gemmatimonadetes bacterium]|nr:AMIN domain-containing protein [Gemmatimonadota bacterium]